MDFERYLDWIMVIVMTMLALFLAVALVGGSIAIGEAVYKDYHQPATGTSCPLEKP